MLLARRFFEVVIAAGLLAGSIVAAPSSEDGGPEQAETLRDGFETDQPTWLREYTDTTIKLIVQDRSLHRP